VRLEDLEPYLLLLNDILRTLAAAPELLVSVWFSSLTNEAFRDI
jgi:hypothetical protein